LFDKVRTCLCGFKHPSQYGDAILMPVRKAQKELIINEWDNVQRIIVSLALKATTQSTIVSKLSAYARNGRYEFRQQPAPVDVEEIVRELADVQIETDSTLAA